MRWESSSRGRAGHGGVRNGWVNCLNVLGFRGLKGARRGCATACHVVGAPPRAIRALAPPFFEPPPGGQDHMQWVPRQGASASMGAATLALALAAGPHGCGTNGTPAGAGADADAGSASPEGGALE